MAPPHTGAAISESGLLIAARDGDHEAYGQLVEPYRGGLHAHCYRMLGSVHDGEDALQETLLRAWRGLARFQGRSSLRSWLYTIATNACLSAIARRPTRMLPVGHVAPAGAEELPGRPLTEAVWVEPYPDAGLEDGAVSPEARYELRESVELAFVAALQLLPATQRAVLVLRDVLGFSAQDTATALGTTVPAANSALQRARGTLDQRLPERSQQATLRGLGDRRLREVVEGYADAMARGDVDAVVGMLAQEAAWSMPPLSTWYRGEAALRGFLVRGPLSGRFRWRHVVTRANAQPAVGGYTWQDDEQAHVPFALDVLTLTGDRIQEVTAFIARQPQSRAPDGFARYPDQPVDPEKAASTFAAFGLPDRLP